jgi:3-hydroxybutyryl-CoA dehydratase
MDELHGYYLEDLSVGMTGVFATTVTEADIVMFSGVSGDTNPVHINQLFAEGSMFKERIAHGMISASFISTVVGTRMPGHGCIYVSQNLRFRAPVKAGDTVVARATVTEIVPDRRRVLLETTCTVGDTVVLDGEAMVMVSNRPNKA